MFMSRHVYTGKSNSLYKAYLDVTQRTLGYLILHLSQDIDERLLFRTNIFPTKSTTVMYSPIDDEATEIELSRPTKTKDGRKQSS